MQLKIWALNPQYYEKKLQSMNNQFIQEISQASYLTMVGFITETIQIQIQIVDQRQFISWQQFLINVMF